MQLCFQKNVVFLGVIIHTEAQGMSCVTRNCLLQCHCGGSLHFCAVDWHRQLFLSKTTPSPVCNWSQHFGRPFVFHSPEKEKVEWRRKTSHLQMCCQGFFFYSNRLSSWETGASPSVWLVVIKAGCPYVWKIKQSFTNKSKRRKTPVKITSYGFCRSALIP